MSLIDQLQQLGITMQTVSGCREARFALQKRPDLDIVLTEAALPDGDWRCVLTIVAQRCPGVEVVVCTDRADATLWCDALEAGAYDLLVQPYYQPEVARIVSAALSAKADKRPGGWLRDNSAPGKEQDNANC